MITSRIASSAKRQLNRIVGVGPWHSLPFSVIIHQRLDVHANGVHSEEDFTGVAAQENEEPYSYRAGESLVGQIKHYEQLRRGPRYRESGLVCPRPKVLFSMTDAGVIADDGVVYCPYSRAAVRETMRSWTTPAETRHVLGAPGIPKPNKISGLSLNLGTLSGGGYYHFLIEGLPKLWLARKFRGLVDHYLVTGQPGGFHEHWLAQAGVPAEKVIWLHALSHLRCDQLLFTGALMGDHQVTPWTAHAVGNVTDAPRSRTPSRCLWISRKDARERHFATEAALLALLPELEPITLSGMSPAAQMALFAEAKLIVGPHGAGLANCIFCTPGGKLIEIFPKEKMQPIYQRIAQIAGMDYLWAQLEPTSDDDINRLAGAIRSAM